MSSYQRLVAQLDPPLIVAIAGALALLGLWAITLIRGKNALGNDGMKEPPMLPGYVPIFGHAFSWFKNSSEIHHRARKWSKNLEPVSISLMGQRAYIVLHPRDVAAVHRSRTLQFDSIVQWSLHTHFGMSKQSTVDIEKDPDGDGSMYVSEHAFFRDALGPGDNLNNLTNIFLRQVKKELEVRIEEIRRAGELSVNLLDWSRDTIGRASSNSVVGTAILDQNPELLEWYTQWQADFFTFSFGMPRWMARKAFENRDKILDAFARHSRDPEALWFVRKREELMIARGLNKRDMGGLTFAFWTGLQANATPTSFWLLHFISHHPSTIPIIRQEIAPAFSSTGELVDLNHLLKNTPLLTSMFHETMRVTSGVVSMRKAEEDTIIGGYLFKKGAMIMLPGRPSHFAEDIWGASVSEFVPDRFVTKEGEGGDDENGGSTQEKKHKGPGIKGVRPFGGGNTLCPGRFFASNEVLSYVATIVWKLDISPPEGEGIATIDTATPTVGTYLPDREVRMRLRLRSD